MTGIQLFACNLYTNFVLLRMRYYQQHGIENFSDYLYTILGSNYFENLNKSCTIFVILIVKNLTLKPEVYNSRDLFVLENQLMQLCRGISLISTPRQVN